MKESFVGKMIGNGQVTIPLTIRDSLKLKHGELVRVTVEKVEP